MRIRYFQTGWGTAPADLEAFLARSRDAGFDGVELYLEGLADEPGRVRRLLRELDLELIGLVASAGATADEHAASLERGYLAAVECGAVAVNSHTGRDHWPLERNLRVFAAVEELAGRDGVPVHHETHRGRATFSLPSTMAVLEALPTATLTADVSHWMVVHEGDLQDQEERLHYALDRARHVHLRVGHAQGPQVSDPRDPAWSEQVARHLDLWGRVVERSAAAGRDVLTFTSEFGPPPYLPTLPFTGEPVADQWLMNVDMRDRVRDEVVPAALGRAAGRG